MQFTRIAYVAALSAALGCTVLATGCAATATEKSVGEVVDDGWITTKVKATFVEDKLVSAKDIQVETFKGTVQLSGFADSVDERSRAADLARNIKGVKGVKNDIRLKAANN